MGQLKHRTTQDKTPVQGSTAQIEIKNESETRLNNLRGKINTNQETFDELE